MSTRSDHAFPRPKQDSWLVNECERFRLTSGNIALARRLLDRLLDEIPRHRSAIAGALERGDLARVRVQAHTLAGGAAYCGIPTVKAAAYALERAADERDRELTSAKFRDLRVAMEALLEQFGRT